MTTKIFLGEPPAHIKQWIIEHSKPVVSEALCFTAKNNQATIRLTKVGMPDSMNLQTSTDGKSWTPYNVEDVITFPNVGDKVYFKAVGSNHRMAISPSDYHKFVTNGQFEASGNVNSLLEENEETARTMSLTNEQFCYAYLFSGTALTKAPELPSTELAYGCYAMMFQNCTYLTQAPELPATTLAEQCYRYMFSDCSSLTQAPELPATTLAEGCYSSMFQGCSNLNTIKLVYTDNFIDVYFTGWVEGVASTGTFYYNGTDETTGTSAIPEGWTVNKWSR